MSTKAERAARASRVVLPIRVRVRQHDGSTVVQRVDASVKVRRPKPAR